VTPFASALGGFRAHPDDHAIAIARTIVVRVARLRTIRGIELIARRC